MFLDYNWLLVIFINERKTGLFNVLFNDFQSMLLQDLMTFRCQNIQFPSEPQISTIYPNYSYAATRLQIKTLFGLEQDTLVLWSNSSCIRSEGWEFKSCRLQKSFSIWINKNLSRKSEQKKKGTLSLIASVSAVAVGEEEETRRQRERSGGIIWSINLIWWRHLTVFV